MPIARWRRWLTPGMLLVAVCVLHGLSPLVLVGIHHPVSGDETVYLSQINRFVPAGVFSAPRSRGLTLLAAPVTMLTTSVVVLRVWLALMSSVLMYACYRPWLKLVPPYVVPMAALLFSTLWTTVFYGFEAMPNLYVALAAVGATALAVGALRRPVNGWRHLGWLAMVSAFVTLVRPSDAVPLVGLLAGATFVVRGVARGVRLATSSALLVGFAAGLAEWVVEAFVRFGGPLQRVHLAQAEQGPGGLHFSLLEQARSVAGPLLCRDSCHAAAPGWALAWWLVLPPLVVAGVTLLRARVRTALLVATAAGLAVAAEYLLTIPYGAPRFLMPTYALLLLPAAAGLVALGRLAGRSWRPLAVGTLGALVVAQAVTQVAVLQLRVLPPVERNQAVNARLAQALRPYVHPGRCIVEGHRAPEVAYADGCLDNGHRRRLDGAAAAGPLSLRPLRAWTVTSVSPRGADDRWYLARAGRSTIAR